MHVGIRAKQIAGVVTIVGLAVVVISLIHLGALVRVSLEESEARGRLIANAVFHRARDVVSGQQDPAAALREDAGLRSILEAAIYSKNVTYAAIADVTGVALVASDRSLEGRPIPPAGSLDALRAEPVLTQWRAIRVPGGQTLEVRQPLLLGGQQFGAIRVGISTLLIGRELEAALRPAAVTALVALAVATLVAWLLSSLILRPIHVIRNGLSQLGRGEFGVTLDLPQQDEFGELGSFFNVVSAQLSADRSELAGQKAKLESVVEHLADAVALISPEGQVLFANAAMKTLMPCDPTGQSLRDVWGEEHPLVRLADHTRRSGQPVSPQVVTVPLPGSGESHDQRGGGHQGGEGAGDGAAGDRLVFTHAIRDATDRLMAVMIVARNVEYLSRVQSTVNYSRKLMALGRLSAGVAHEVKNPLNAMTIHLELLKQKLTSWLGQAASGSEAQATAPEANLAAALEHVRVIGAEIRRLDEVVQGFLRFTRPEDLKLQPVSVADLLADVCRSVAPEAAAAGIEVKVEGVRSVPAINVDPTMVRQAFLNLALNACQAMPDGGVLRFSAAPASDNRVQILVQDTGVGIKAEHLPRIFDLYFTTRPQGSGIGLSMVYRTIQLHDGDIEVQSVEGRGTTFRVTLPRA